MKSGVLPYQKRDGTIEVLLITSRTRRRWIIPKGHIEPDLTVRQSAIAEAHEEAGIEGTVPADPMGTYHHGIPPDTNAIELFLMQVERTLDHWPEEEVRQRRWLALPEARRRVYETGLKQLMDKLPSVVVDF